MEIRKWFPDLFPTGFVVLLCCSRIALSQPAPCTLLTQDQLSTVVGMRFGAGSPIATTGCSWSSTGAAKVTVTVSMQSEKMFAGAKSAPNTTKVSGVGDDAFFSGVQGFTSLWVRKGSRMVMVRLYGLPANEAQPKVTTLAKAVVARL